MLLTRCVRCLALCLILPALVGARQPNLDPSLYGTWEPVWTARLPRAAAEATVFRVYQLNLLTAGQAEGRLALHRLPLRADGLESETPEPLSQEGLPERLVLKDFQVSASAGRAVLADERRLFAAPIDARATIGKWAELPTVPLHDGERIARLAVRDSQLLVLTDRSMSDDSVRLGGWAANLEATGNLFRWRELPPTPAGRDGAAAMALRESLVVGGGRPQGAEPTAKGERGLDVLPFDGEVPGAWTRSPLDLFEPLPDAVGASYGAGLYLAARTPRPAIADEPTSQSLFLAVDRREGALSPWRKMFLPDAPQPVRAMAVDPGHNRLLMVREGTDGGVLITALPLAETMQGRIISADDVRRVNDRRTAERVEPQNVRTVLERAKSLGMPALVVIASDEDSGNAVRARMTQNRFRYLTQGAVSGFLGADDGRAVAAQYKVEKQPAFLLLDPSTGREIARHEGSFPSPEELFRLTGPLRQAAGSTSPGGKP